MTLSSPKGQSSDQDTAELSADQILGLDLDAEDDVGHWKAEDKDDDSDGFGPRSVGGFSLDNIYGLITSYWYHALAAVAVILLLIAIMSRGGGEPQSTAEPSGDNKPQQASSEQPSGSVNETGVGFAEPVDNEDGYYLRSGEISWKGEAKETDTGQQITLEGPTAAQFKKAVTLPGGGIMTGVFGRAEPDQPIIHGTFHRISFGDQEETTGTYYAAQDESILVKGTYTDTRDGDTVTRTYNDDYPDESVQDPAPYSVSFEAPPDTPIPTLVGWEPPALEEASPEAG